MKETEIIIKILMIVIIIIIGIIIRIPNIISILYSIPSKYILHLRESKYLQ